MADPNTGQLSTLLRNIKANLEDSTNYAAVTSRVKKVYITPVFYMPEKTTPCAVIVPGVGSVVDEGSYLTEISRVVSVYVATRLHAEPTGSKGLIGNITAIEGLESICRRVRKALNRSDPYGAGKPSGATYTTMTQCDFAGYQGEDEPTIENTYGLFNPTQGLPALVIRMEFLYRYFETRE